MEGHGRATEQGNFASRAKRNMCSARWIFCGPALIFRGGNLAELRTPYVSSVVI